MASQIARGSLSFGKRGLAAQAATATKKVDSANLQTTQLSNGVTVASLDTGAGVSSLAVCVKAGSRHETYDNLGINHALRAAAGLSSSKHSSLATVRTIQQVGGKVDVVGSREYTLYCSQAPRNSINEVMECFTSMVDCPSFKPWEVAEFCPERMYIEIAGLTEADIANELLHKAAFREGLGNSLYSHQHMLGKHKPAMLQDFHTKNYTADRTVLIGLDVSHDQAVKCGELLNLPKSGVTSLASKFVGSAEHRQVTTSGLAVIAVATGAASAANVKEAVANRILQHILGISPRVKRGNGQGQLQKALSKVNGDASVAAINYSYSDVGLLGAFIASDPQCAGKALEEVVAALRSINVSEAELANAKKSLKLTLSEESLSSSSCIETMATNASLGSVLTPAKMVELFEKASLSDVQAAAKKLTNAKFSLGAAGNLGNVPHIDQL
eukprot:11108.XXX_681867_683643_1 [CDS] Oithona nana genome sequencing.